MDGLMVNAGVRTVAIHLYLCVLFCPYFSLWLCKHKPLNPPTYSVVFCANIKNKQQLHYVCLNIMDAFFVWNVGFCLVSGKLSALRNATFCKVAWH